MQSYSISLIQALKLAIMYFFAPLGQQKQSLNTTFYQITDLEEESNISAFSAYLDL